MTSEEARQFADRWADAWNRRDLDTILSHFTETVEFTSPVAVEAVGTATVQGKAALRAYWTKALGPIRSLRFIVNRVLWRPESRELAIVYDRAVNDKADRAIELLRFDATGHVTHGEVFYGRTPLP